MVCLEWKYKSIGVFLIKFAKKLSSTSYWNDVCYTGMTCFLTMHFDVSFNALSGDWTTVKVAFASFYRCFGRRVCAFVSAVGECECGRVRARVHLGTCTRTHLP